MKKMTILLAAIICSTQVVFAQMPALRGSGVLITRTYPLKGFDKLALDNLDGRIDVEVGKTFSISVSIDDNLDQLLALQVQSGKLSISLRGNENNRLYVENSSIRIKITMPEISVLQHNGNSRLMIDGIAGRYLRLENMGNGQALLKGTVDELDIVKNGNGEIDARLLSAKTVAIKAMGNGDTRINTNNAFRANGTGNGDVINYGKGMAAAGSSVEGNGSISNAAGTQR